MSEPIPVPAEPSTLPSYTSVSFKPLHDSLYSQVFSLIVDKASFFPRSSSPYQYKSPSELKKLLNFSLAPSGSSSASNSELYSFLEKVVAYSPHRAHPYYLHPRGGGLDPFGVLGDYLGTITSTAVLTYLFAPVHTLMEEEVKSQIMKLMEYPPDTDPTSPRGGKGYYGQGIVVPGGGFAAFMAFRAAIHVKYPVVKLKGMEAAEGSQRFCIFISEHAAPHLKKDATIAGFGTDNVIEVGVVKKSGRMDVAELRKAVERAKQRNLRPFIVVATAGTEATGAIDPVGELADVCQEHDMWLHVDGTYGGPYVLSDTQRQAKLRGINRADSFCMSSEGLLGMPYCSTILFSTHRKVFYNTFALGAKVVFEFGPSLLYDAMAYDNGDFTIQTSRRPDIPKLWLAWKAKGRKGLEAHVDYVEDTIKPAFLQELTKRSGKFHLILPGGSDSTRIAFYYVPSGLRAMMREVDHSNPQMSFFSRNVQRGLLKDGKVVLGLGKLPGHPEYFLVSLNNSALTGDDAKYIVDTIEAYGTRQEADLTSNIFGPRTAHDEDEEEDADDDRWLESSSLPELTLTQPSEETNADEVKAGPPGDPASPPDFVSAPIESKHKDLYNLALQFIKNEGVYYQDKLAQPPLTFLKPEVLLETIDLSLQEDPSAGNEIESVVDLLRQVNSYSIHQAHPFYVFQLLSGGLDPYGIMADFVGACNSSSMLSYEESPFFTLMEQEIFRSVRKIIGYPTPRSHPSRNDPEGIINPGGSISIITAIYTALYWKFPQAKRNGIRSVSRPTFYMSANGHFASQKGSVLFAIGVNNCVLVDVDMDGRMDVGALRAAILKTKESGGSPFCVVATSGTTVLGVFDPLAEISRVCQEFGLWLHSDGSVGGSIIMSEKYRQRYLKGTELTDSFNFNPHKWFGIPQETSVIVFKRQGIVHETFGSRAAGHALQWDRRPNAIKFWLLWKAKGVEGMGKHIEWGYARKDFMVAELKRPERQPMFRLWKDDFHCAGVAFHYFPKSLRDVQDKNSKEFNDRLDKVGQPLVASLITAGIMVIGVYQDADSPMLLKFLLMSSGLTDNEIVYLLDQVDNYGQDLVI